MLHLTLKQLSCPYLTNIEKWPFACGLTRYIIITIFVTGGYDTITLGTIGDIAIITLITTGIGMFITIATKHVPMLDHVDTFDVD